MMNSETTIYHYFSKKELQTIADYAQSKSYDFYNCDFKQYDAKDLLVGKKFDSEIPQELISEKFTEMVKNNDIVIIAINDNRYNTVAYFKGMCIIEDTHGNFKAADYWNNRSDDLISHALIFPDECEYHGEDWREYIMGLIETIFVCKHAVVNRTNAKNEIKKTFSFYDESKSMKENIKNRYEEKVKSYVQKALSSFDFADCVYKNKRDCLVLLDNSRTIMYDYINSLKIAKDIDNKTPKQSIDSNLMDLEARLKQIERTMK